MIEERFAIAGVRRYRLLYPWAPFVFRGRMEGVIVKGLLVRGLIVRGLSKIVFVLMIIVSVEIIKLFLYKLIKKIQKH